MTDLPPTPPPPDPVPGTPPQGVTPDYGTGAPTGYPGPYMGPTPDKDARTMAMLAHLLSLAGIIIPLGNIIGPLVIWLVKKDSSPFVDDQGKESLNFQIWVTILAIIAAFTICIGVGFVLLPVIAIGSIVLSIIAAVKANEGVAYRYPLTPFRLIK